MTLKELAYSILDKTTKADVAVFIWAGEVKTTKAGGSLCESLTAGTKWKLVGVYNDACKLEWMMDDLKYVGAKHD